MRLREQRRFFRVDLGDLPVTVRVVQTGGLPVPGPELAGRLLNLSGGGALWQAQVDLPVRERLVVNLAFTLDSEPFALDAHILRKTDTLTAYEYACQYVDLPERVQANLVKALNQIEMARRKVLRR